MNFKQPYNSRRSPICAKNVVASSQPLATQAGLKALQDGGNAVDAALACAITLTVVEPCNNGLGSDAFAILWDGDRVVGLNASGRAPQAWTREYFGNVTKIPDFGWDSVTVPGAVSAWVALSERYGKLPFNDLFDAAIEYAQNGFAVGPVTAQVWKYAERAYQDYPDFAEHFLPTPNAADLFRRPDMVRSLELIRDSHGEDFYHGELARQISLAATDAGAGFSLQDLKEHEANWITPIEQPYNRAALHEIPPNGQGLAAQIALGILSHVKTGELDSPVLIHQQIEAMKIAIRAAFDHFSDLATMRITPAQLLDQQSLNLAAQQISKNATHLPPAELPVSKDTVYLCAADKDGMMVSFIQSNYLGFGSGIVIPKTGIAMQNRGRGFSLDPEHPNCVGPGKRPFHTIIPGFATYDQKPSLAFGVMGGHMQHQGHVQMMQRIFDFDQNPQAACDAPRWHVYPDFSVGLEVGTSEAVYDALVKRGHKVKFETDVNVFGGAQLIQKVSGGYVAGSDHRKEGQAAGY